MVVLIAYDIREDKTRRHVARTLEAYGHRVQRSVFECEVTRPQYDALKGQLEAALEAPEESDSIRCYQLCGACVRKASVIGTGSLAEDPSYYLV